MRGLILINYTVINISVNELTKSSQKDLTTDAVD